MLDKYLSDKLLHIYTKLYTCIKGQGLNIVTFRLMVKILSNPTRSQGWWHYTLSNLKAVLENIVSILACKKMKVNDSYYSRVTFITEKHAKVSTNNVVFKTD